MSREGGAQSTAKLPSLGVAVILGIRRKFGKAD